MANSPSKQSSTTKVLSTSTHQIVQTLFGPVCLKCNTKVVKNQTKFKITDDTLRKHFDNNKCHTTVNVRQLRQQLNQQIECMHETIQSSPSQGKAMVQRCFPTETTTSFRSNFCNRCGYFDEFNKVKNHISNKNNKCCIINYGFIAKSQYRFEIPQAFLFYMENGLFVLPYLDSKIPKSSKLRLCGNLYDPKLLPLPDNVVKLYKIISKVTGELGGNSINGPIYGESVSDIYVSSFHWFF